MQECCNLYGEQCGKMPSPLSEGVFFLKPFKTLTEQIQLLRNRNLTINDEDYAKKYLLSNNYYNIINGYSKFFPMEGENYIGGTTFEEVARLYLFDKELKQAFFKAILNAESHLKSIFAYRFAELFSNKPYSYLNIECYTREKTLSVISTISRLSQIISRQQKFPESSIAHYIQNHNEIPIWVLVNQLEFGELRNMLTSSTVQLQNRVAKDLCDFIKQNLSRISTFPPEIMISFVENMNEVRNICAHTNRLIGFKCRRDSKYWNVLHDNYGIAPENERRNVYSVFVSTQCFLSKMEYCALNNKIKKLVHIHLEKHLNSITSNEIMQKLGFPTDWHLLPKLTC